MIRRWLVLGGSGRLGGYVRTVWTREPPAASIVWQSRRPAPWAELSWSPAAGPLEAALARRIGQIDAALILFGVTAGDTAALAANVDLARAGLDAARRLGAKRALVASSAAVYGPGGDVPLAEDATPAPVNDYGRAKLEMESVCETFARREDLEVCALRIGNVAGADMLLRNAAHASREAPLLLDRFEDGTGPVRSYIGAETLARVLGKLLASPAPLPRLLNLAAPGAVAMEALLQAADVPWTFRAAPVNARQRVVLDTTRLEQLVHFVPTDSDPAAMVAQATQVEARA